MRAHLVLLLFGVPLASGLDNLKLKGPSTFPNDASSVLHPALASFSIETAFFEDFFGNATHPNKLSLTLLSNLKDRAGGYPPEIRIGGITADSTYWRPDQKEALVNFVDSTGALHNTTIGPEFWKIVGLLPDITNITVNLDLEDADYEGALAMARATMQHLKPDQIATFEIGNEPDHFRRFDPASYTSIWSKWAKDISTALELPSPRFQLAATAEDPLWPYDTQEAKNQLSCVSALAAGANKDKVVRSCSEHTYQYSVCDPARTSVATLPNLVNHTRLAMYLDLWQPRIKSVREQLDVDRFVIGEYNSVSCSGKDGVSNTFGQAMWLLDTTFYAASINISRLYIHNGGPLALQSSSQLNHGGLSFYDMWYPVDNKNGPIQVFPSYHAYLFVAETLGHSESLLHISNIYPGRQSNGSSITTALGDSSSGELVAYGFWGELQRGHPTKLALLNMQIWNETSSGKRPAAMFDVSDFLVDKDATYTVKRLQAPGADVKDGAKVTWVGQTFAGKSGSGLPDGLPQGEYKEEKASGGQIWIAASEAVLVVQNVGGRAGDSSRDQSGTSQRNANMGRWRVPAIVFCAYWIVELSRLFD